MDDAEYLFKSDAREKKIIAHSARKKVTHTGCNLPSDYMTRKEKKAMNGEVKRMNIHKPMTYKFFKMMSTDLQAEYIMFLHDTFNASTEDIAKKFGIARGSLHNYMYRNELKINLRTNQRAKLKEQEWEAFWAGETVENIQNAPESDEKARSETNGVSEGESAVSENASESDEKARSEANYVLNKKLLEDGYITENEFREQIGLPKLREEIRQYIEKDIRTLDEVILEQPFSMGSMNISLRDIRDWDSVVKALSAFPLPAHNSVTISIHEIKEE